MDGLRIGCSGWDYKEWIGPFYPGVKSDKLRYYSTIFNTVEVNSSFYRMPKADYVKEWCARTPPDFMFTVKMPKTVTHDKWLDLEQGVEKDVKEFIDVLDPMIDEGKLGCVLIQLRPKFGYQPRKLAAFLDILPRTVEYAVEFRNRTWIKEETFELLKDHEVAYTIVDEPLLPPVNAVTSQIAYVRWHGKGEGLWYDYMYSDEEIRPWTENVERLLSGKRRVFGFFNNHFHANAPENALKILHMMGKAVEKQEGKLTDMEDHRSGISRTVGMRITDY